MTPQALFDELRPEPGPRQDGKTTLAGAPFSAACIAPAGDGTFTFNKDGEPAVVIGVEDRDGVLCDLVAWLPEDPGRWWLRHADEMPILGARELAVAAYFGDPIALYATPEQWLIAGRRGACVLMWDAPLRDLFEGVASICCNSLELRGRLRKALRQSEPRLAVARREVRHGA